MRANVVDVSGCDLGAALVEELAPDAQHADESALHEPTGLVALVPALIGQSVPDTAEFWFRLDRTVASREARAEAPEWLVVVWSVRLGDRQIFATPHDAEETINGECRYGGRNAAMLVIGAGWPRELHRHGGDPAAALRCRSDQLERVLDADSHHRMAGADSGRVRRDLRILDRHVVHTVLVETRPEAVAPRQRWSGWEAVTAAVALRTKS